MHLKRIIICILVGSMFFSMIGNVNAIQENKIINDAEDDVISYDPLTMNETTTNQKPNIDIIQITYDRDGKTVTTKLKVKGVIEDRGDLSSFMNEEPDEENLKIDIAMYSILIITSGDTYTLLYVNKTCNLSSNQGQKDISTFKVKGNTLEITFELNDENEVYDSLQALTYDYKLSMLGGFMYMDEANDQPLTIELEETYEGEINTDISFYAYVTGGAYPYTYKWDFGDGSTSTEMNPKHKYETKGEYTLKLTVTDSNNEKTTASSIVKITDPNEENGGNGEKKTGNNIVLFAVIILIVIVIGIIAVVYIIKR